MPQGQDQRLAKDGGGLNRSDSVLSFLFGKENGEWWAH